MAELPCPCCGFLAFEGSYGTYDKCNVCGWEDDHVQLANPTSEGGANLASLAEAQQKALEAFPLDRHTAAGLRRSTRWRPLAAADLERARTTTSAGIRDEAGAYWIRDAVAAQAPIPRPPAVPPAPTSSRRRRDELPSPSKEEIAEMPPFERIGLDRILVAADAASAARALALLAGAAVLGFDTESRPTFTRGEASDGPHVVQLSTREHAVIFQLHDPASRDAAARVLQDARVKKVGFGLGDDKKRIVAKLGIEPHGVVDLNADFRQLGHRREMGVRASVALLFGKRFLKSSKAATSNWALPRLSEQQVLYAANDAWAALLVHDELLARS